LQKNKNIAVFNFNNDRYLSLLRIQSIRIGIWEKEGSQGIDEKKIIINEMKFVFFDSNKPNFKPTMSVNYIEKEYVQGKTSWYIESEEKEREVLSNLIYYSLFGNEYAKKLFYSYQHEDVANSEYISYLQEWFEKTLDTNNKIKK
jgi:hypothetical protein